MSDDVFVVEAKNAGDWQAVEVSDVSWHAIRQARGRSIRGPETRVRRSDTGIVLIIYREGMAQPNPDSPRNPTL